MPLPNYRRTVEELRSLASMFWPPELSEREAELSVIPKLLETQDSFIAILGVPVPNLDALLKVVNTSTIPANLFLKHLVVLADFGGEMLQRVNGQFPTLFPAGRLDYFWNEERHTYEFRRLPVSGMLTNQKLSISGATLLDNCPLNELLQDVVAVLLFGSACAIEETSQVLARCEVGTYLGQPEKLSQFIKQRYIWVSRITGGAQANTLGQIAQRFVKEYIENHLAIRDIKVTPNDHLPGVTHADELANRPTSFDIVISNGGRYAAVEVSFQVTTNSTIERKAGQARSRFEQIEAAGHTIAYVIDGAGNFQRQTAIGTLCAFSHCTVAFSRQELDVLCEYLRSYFTADR